MEETRVLAVGEQGRPARRHPPKGLGTGMGARPKRIGGRLLAADRARNSRTVEMTEGGTTFERDYNGRQFAENGPRRPHQNQPAQQCALIWPKSGTEKPSEAAS